MNRLDVYTAVHKMQRARLCNLIVCAGTTDPDDSSGRIRLAGAVNAMIIELRTHAEHEDRFIHPLLRAASPHLATRLEAEHGQLDAQLEHLGSTAASYAELGTPSADPNTFYRALADFTAIYFAHVAVEEREALPALWNTCGDDELMGILVAFNASRSPIESLTSVLAQLPTLNPVEINRMVGAAIDGTLRPELAEVLATLLSPTQLGALASLA